MKKILKITGMALLSLVLLAVAAVLLARYCFRDEAEAWVSRLVQNERLELLRASGAYAEDADADFRFVYRQDSVRAKEIRDYFRLDTLYDASAATWENTKNIARFVASNIPHANQTVQPETRNAIELWKYTRSVEPAFNCRLHSIMLHELLLSCGIVNRFVTCLPADSEDCDCHVVNVVWLPEAEKWAMIDSDMRAWVSDLSGVPLSLAEMRERFIADEPVEVHHLFDADWSDDDYCSYWAKNLYWFDCWEETGYDKEVGCGGRRVVLLPSGFGGFRLGENVVATSDDGRFWAKPED
ncbi:MAG: transglutaminase domain-containing protein [Alistipes sp.]|nr:transglutaminase domain-containing protein [Alistipes sp.]